MDALVKTPPDCFIVPPAPDTESCPPPRCTIAPEPNTTVNLGAFLREARDDGFPAQSERPPGPVPVRWRRGLAWLAAAAAVPIVAIVAALAHRGCVAAPRAAARSTVVRAAMPIRDALVIAPCIPGERRTLVRGVRLGSGLETDVSDGRIAAAVSTSVLEARAVEIDAATLAVRATARLTRTQPVRRALPLLVQDGGLDVEADDGASFPAAGDVVRLRAPRADAVRAAPAQGTRAVVFRRDGVVWAATSSEAGALDGPVAVSRGRGGPGAGVGAPSVATTRAGDVVVAWAERASAGDAWRVRWTRWTPGLEPEEPRTWPVPAIAPAVAALPGGGTLLAWTEGGGGAHVVRAGVLGDDGLPRGEPLTLSSPAANAGQERLVLSPDGRGVVFFLEADAGGRFALVARTLSCAPR
jgi:hypothetical protein